MEREFTVTKPVTVIRPELRISICDDYSYREIWRMKCQRQIRYFMGVEI